VSAKILTLSIRTYWLHARGEGGGADYDLVMETDGDGLPMLRGRHVAGLLRLALARAEHWGWFAKVHKDPVIAAAIAAAHNGGATADGANNNAPLLLYITELLMGVRTESKRGGPQSLPGCLAVGNARVPERIRKALREKIDGKERITAATAEAFRRRIDSTAIDEVRGVAKQAHLRSVEAAIPLPLEFAVSFAPDDFLAAMHDNAPERKACEVAERRWTDWLEIAWPAFDEVGAKRTRGFGRLGWSDPKSWRDAAAGRAS
jgi:hypothetical protein